MLSQRKTSVYQVLDIKLLSHSYAEIEHERVGLLNHIFINVLLNLLLLPQNEPAKQAIPINVIVVQLLKN